MKEELLEEIEKEYYKSIETRENNYKRFLFLSKLQGIINRFPILEKHINFSEKINDFFTNYTYDDDVLEGIVNNHTNELILDNNSIYFYAGCFGVSDGQEWRYTRESNKGEYDLYINVESNERIINPVSNREMFEKEKNIVILMKPFPTDIDYKDLRMDFFRSAMDENQETACVRVLNRKF